MSIIFNKVLNLVRLSCFTLAGLYTIITSEHNFALTRVD
jgi:hypothetical protein